MVKIKLQDESWKQLALLTDSQLVLYYEKQEQVVEEEEEKKGIEMTRL